MLLLIAAAVVSAALAIRAQRAEKKALADRNRAIDAEGLALERLDEARAAKKSTEQALVQSEESRRQAEAVSRFLTDAFRSPDPSLDGRTVQVADLLNRAATQLEQDFTGSPETKGALLDALGETYRGLGLYDEAVSKLTKASQVRESALGPDHALTFSSRNNLANAYRAAGRTGPCDQVA